MRNTSSPIGRFQSPDFRAITGNIPQFHRRRCPADQRHRESDQSRRESCRILYQRKIRCFKSATIQRIHPFRPDFTGYQQYSGSLFVPGCRSRCLLSCHRRTDRQTRRAGRRMERSADAGQNSWTTGFSYPFRERAQSIHLPVEPSVGVIEKSSHFRKIRWSYR